MVALGLSFPVYRMELIISKKAFLSEQCKEIEENNRMGKTRELLKKIRDIKETFLGSKITADGDCSHEEIPHIQGKRNPSKTVHVARGHQRADTLKP